MQHSDHLPLQRARHARSRTSRVRDRGPAPRPRPVARGSRRSRLRARLAAASGLVALLGLGVAVVAGWLLPGGHHLEQTAVRLRDSGLSVVADGARVVQEGSGRNARDALEASFRTREQQLVTVRLLGSGTDWGIERPPQPLTVFYDPTRPDRAMAADDVRYYTEDAVSGALGMVVLGVLAALVGGGGWWIWRPSDH